MILSTPIVSLSGRLVLSAPTEAHDEAVTILDNDPGSTAFRPFVPAIVTVQDIRARRISAATNPTILLLVIHTRPQAGCEPEFVGEGKIYHMDHYYGNSCEVGLVLSSKYIGTGMGRDATHSLLSYAFEELQFHRVNFRVTPDNVNLLGWMERIGATFEGIARDGSWDGNGGYKDVINFSMLDGEWIGGLKGRMGRKILGA
jgi:RimJ/RimL family protein N-acetyltransferase